MGPLELINFDINEVQLAPGGATEWSFSDTFSIVTGQVRLSPDETAVQDQDGDGLLDCEELAGGIDVNCDGALVSGEDVLFSELHAVPPDPTVPDIYVEVDWADCNETATLDGEDYGLCEVIDSRTSSPDRRSFEPPQEVFNLIEDEFSDNGYQLHFKKSGAFPATMGVPARRESGEDLAFSVLPSLVGSTTDEALYAVYRGIDPDREPDREPHLEIFSNFFGDVGDSPEVIAEKAKFMRYNIWSHSRTYFSNWGVNPGYGPIFVVGADTSVPARFQDFLPLGGRIPREEATLEESPHIWATVVMHELGHSLGLGHGGADRDELEGKPNYLSVMNYSYADVLDGSSRSTELPQLRYNEIDRTFDQCQLSEVPSEGPPPQFPLGSSEDFTVRYLCPDAPAGYGDTTDRGGAIDWNCDGVKAGSGDFNLFQFMCMRAQAVSLPIPSGEGNDDRIIGGTILNADSTMPPNSEPHPDDELLAGWIDAGADGVLNTVVAPGDVVIGGWIEPGPDGACDTAAFYQADGTTPVEGLVNVQEVGAKKPCEVTAPDDWESLKVQLPGAPRTGANPAFLLPEDPGDDDPFEAERRLLRRTPVDLGLELSSTTFDPVARTLNVEYTITNHSANDSLLAAAVSLILAEGAEFQGCIGDATNCTQYAGRAVASLPAIAAGTSLAVTFQLQLDCPSWGDAHALDAKISSVAIDPDRDNNVLQTLTTFGADLSVSSTTRPWVRSYSGEQPMDLTEDGEIILGCGNTIFESPTFDTRELGSVGTELLVDVLVPSGTPSGWVGDLQLHVDVPGGDLWNQSAGYQALSAPPQGTWTTLSFDLPQEVREVLLGDHPDARLRFASNVAACSQGVLFRDVRMGGSMECHPGGAVSDAVVSSSVLTFDSVSDWDVESGSIAGTSAGTQGSGAVEFDPTGWGRLVSRSFSTSELTGVSDTLAFDVYIPDLPADFYWLGGMNLFIDCPAAGLWNSWTGYQALQILFDGEFNRVTYPLRPEVVEVLQQPSVQCSVALEISSNPAFGGFILDNGGFVQ